jgi:rod shape-determining protein MreC
MAVLDIRQRTGWLFVGLTIAHIVLISLQVKTRGVPVFEAVTFGAFAEVQRAATGGVGSVRDTWQNYFALQQIRRENTALTQQVAKLQMTLQEERAAAQRSRTLESLLELRGQTQLMTTGATVIGGPANPEFRTLTIDKGKNEGLRSNMAVIAPQGVVGRVILPTGRAAKVQLLVDKLAAVGAMIERTRAQGIVHGLGTDRLQLDDLPSSADVQVGDRIVTAGIDAIYPKGFVIGQVESVKRSGGEYRDVIVKPAVDFTSIETVLVVLTPPPSVADVIEEERRGVEKEKEKKPAPAAVPPSAATAPAGEDAEPSEGR